jgi:hypothetical protein
MKNKEYSIFTFVMVVVFLSSCKKDEINYKTIYPLPYFPVYPGSYWKYITENGDTITQTTSADYLLDSYYIDELEGIKTTPVYVPLWNNIPIYGYSTPRKYISTFGLRQIPFLKFEKGIYWTTSISEYYIVESAKTIAVDTSIIVNGVIYDSVIVVEGFRQDKYHVTDDTYTYYAKNIGLIKKVHLSIMLPNGGWDTTSVLNIIDYHINH